MCLGSTTQPAQEGAATACSCRTPTRSRHNNRQHSIPGDPTQLCHSKGQPHNNDVEQIDLCEVLFRPSPLFQITADWHAPASHPADNGCFAQGAGYWHTLHWGTHLHNTGGCPTRNNNGRQLGPSTDTTLCQGLLAAAFALAGLSPTLQSCKQHTQTGGHGGQVHRRTQDSSCSTQAILRLA